MPDDEMVKVPALFLTGAPGSGKTARAHELSELLFRAGEPHAVICMDEPARGVLHTGSDDFNLALAATNLSAVWANFRDLGVRRLILDRIVLSAGDLQTLCDAVSDCEVTVCRVVAASSDMAQDWSTRGRFRSRVPAVGIGTDQRRTR